MYLMMPQVNFMILYCSRRGAGWYNNACLAETILLHCSLVVFCLFVFTE